VKAAIMRRKSGGLPKMTIVHTSDNAAFQPSSLRARSGSSIAGSK
jgi:hypothetical protein